MIKDLGKAIEILHTNGHTCVLCRNDETYVSTQRGVKPLVAWLKNAQNFEGFFAADKVVGKATAFLYVLLGVKAVYAGVISRPALEVLQNNGIYAEFGEVVDNIINRQGDGICPFESVVLDIQNPTAAYKAICEKMNEMNILI